MHGCLKRRKNKKEAGNAHLKISARILGKVFLKKEMGQPCPLFFIYFWSFQTNNTIFTTINVEKCPSSIRRPDLNTRPLKRESSPITTGPGHPPSR